MKSVYETGETFDEIDRTEVQLQNNEISNELKKYPNEKYASQSSHFYYPRTYNEPEAQEMFRNYNKEADYYIQRPYYTNTNDQNNEYRRESRQNDYSQSIQEMYYDYAKNKYNAYSQASNEKPFVFSLDDPYFTQKQAFQQQPQQQQNRPSFGKNFKLSPNIILNPIDDEDRRSSRQKPVNKAHKIISAIINAIQD